jgi:porin
MMRKKRSQIYVSATLLTLAVGSASLGFAEEAKTAEDAISSVREKLKKLEANQQATPSPTPPQPEVKITVVPSPVAPSASPKVSDEESENEEQAPPPKKKKEKKKKRKIKEKSKSKSQAKKEAENLEKLASETPLPQRSATRETQEVPPVAESPMEDESRLTKNWGGARKKLSDLGIDVALIYRGEWNRNFSGGVRQASTYLSNIDLRVSMDGEKLVGWKGGSVFFYGLSDLGGDPSKNVGDAQVSSNIETPVNTAKVYELWAQQILFEDKVSVLVGMHDLNSEFYVTDSSGLFFNSTLGVGKDISQSGVNGPSIFPTTAPAIRLRAEPTKEFYFQFGVWNGQSGNPGNPYGTKFRLNAKDGLLLVSEMAYLRGKIDQTKNPGKYGIGYWTYTRTFDSLHNSIVDSAGNAVPTQATSHGVYFLAEQSIFGNVTLFCRYGIASTEVNRFGTSLGTGMVFTGLVPHRPKDRFGVALARVTKGVEVPGAESTIEANYRIELLPGIAVQPDYQYIIHPQGDPVANPNLANASVGAVRFELSF